MPAPSEAREALDPSGVPDSVEQPDVGAGNQTRVSWSISKLLATQPAL